MGVCGFPYPSFTVILLLPGFVDHPTTTDSLQALGNRYPVYPFGWRWLGFFFRSSGCHALTCRRPIRVSSHLYVRLACPP
jgi:hypothetical protein